MNNLFEIKNVDLSEHFYSKLKCNGDLVIIESIEILKDLLIYCKNNKLKYHLLGAGSNQVILNTKNIIFIKLNLKNDIDYLKEAKIFEEYTFTANTHLSKLSKIASVFKLKGWEYFTGVPASLAGAVYMNAGTRLGEIGSLVKKVTLMLPSAQVCEKELSEKDFSYRKNNFLNKGEIILDITLKHFGVSDDVPSIIKEYLLLRNKTQPLKENNLGCCFKNPSPQNPAGMLIDKAGLKGYRKGNLEVSLIHANFINNLGSATAKEYYDFVQEIKLKVKEKFNITLEEEIKFF